MTYYEILLFLHVAAAVLWLGGGATLQLIGVRATSTDDDVALAKLFDAANWLANRLFIPSSLAVLVLGMLLTIEGPWAFGDLWIVLGLVGYAATFAFGVGVVKPSGERIAALMEREGGVTPPVAAAIRSLFMTSRIDLAVLFMVVADMTLKPTADDLGTLAAMAIVIGATAVYAILGARAAGTPEGPGAREPA